MRGCCSPRKKRNGCLSHNQGSESLSVFHSLLSDPNCLPARILGEHAAACWAQGPPGWQEGTHRVGISAPRLNSPLQGKQVDAYRKRWLQLNHTIKAPWLFRFLSCSRCSLAGGWDRWVGWMTLIHPLLRTLGQRGKLGFHSMAQSFKGWNLDTTAHCRHWGSKADVWQLLGLPVRTDRWEPPLY